MTYEEAIEVIKGFRKLVYTDDLRGMEKSDYDKQAINMAIAALEKQKPKKPIKTGWYRIDSTTEFLDWKCPNCGKVLFRKRLTDDCCEPLTYGTPHHCVCGQAIDWSD